MSYADLWAQAFTRTYGSEFRSESDDYARGLYEADPARYAEAARLALTNLAATNVIDRVETDADGYRLERSESSERLARLRWHASRPLAKLLAIFRLLKTATTFGDWLPYALWKLERHSGVRPELTERQRRHPLIYGWPVIFRLLTQKALR